MNVATLALTEDLSWFGIVLTVALVLLSLVLLGLELARKGRPFRFAFAWGALATLAFAGAVFRPVRVTAKSSTLGPRVVVLVDDSRRLALPEGKEQRRDLEREAVKTLGKHFSDARLTFLGFGDGEPHPFAPDQAPTERESDLSGALGALSRAPGERPQAVVVVSDGRLTRPLDTEPGAQIQQWSSNLGIPIHSIGLIPKAPPDASLRQVRTAGAAVAHQPLSISIEVGCDGGLDCSEIPIKIRELLLGEAPVTLATGVVSAEDSVGKAELEVTLDRAGSRVLEVSIDSPDGDVIPENDTRTLAFSVARERVRLLHLAGRPTYDVRALRNWLKSDESVDVVAFFILRGDFDDPGATESELSLIRFPVDELFVQHLPSFDAVILQDIDAIKYKLDQHLVRLRDYVQKGGGLIMVGGPASFAGGNYAGTPIDSVLPVEQPRQGKAFDSEEFVPAYTEAGRAAPVTRSLRALLGNELPPMSGTNLLGVPRTGSIVLLQHPKLEVAGRPMPTLALGEAGDGRSIALGLDSTQRLGFGHLAASVQGRAYGALWDGLLGWLMRDPRYEAARVELAHECIAGEPLELLIHRLPGMSGDVELSLEPLVPARRKTLVQRLADNHSATLTAKLPPQEAGGYAVRVAVGAAPPTRQDIACERGGSAWADSRPDNARLEAISKTTGGRFVDREHITDLPRTELVRVTRERRATPLLPAWVWTLSASLLLGAHWVSRRRGGLS